GLESLKHELAGKPVFTRVADVTDVTALRAAVREAEAESGPTDVLIASAGVGRGTPAASWRAEDVNAVLNVNLLGVVNSIDAVLPGMRERKSGHLVVLSSLASYRGMPHMAAYSASKAGCNALCDSLRVELADDRIAVTCVCPGWVRTPMTEAIGIPPRIMVPAEAAARRILQTIRGRRSFDAFPLGVAWQAWLLRSLPRPIGDWLARQLLRKIRAMQAGR
ncbi:MAG: SDR family NAD(P)-dependent oxidoreductase, partial [Gemmataceae bacterium]